MTTAARLQLTADQKRAIAAYDGASSQILALILFEQRLREGSSWLLMTAEEEVLEFNEFLAAVRLERGR